MPKKRIPQNKKNNKKKIPGHSKEYQEIKYVVKTIKEIFKRKTIHNIAKKSGLIQRHRKLDEYIFFCH